MSNKQLLNNLKTNKMKHNIIKTENYLLVVDDSEIKNWYLDDVGVVRKAITWDEEYWSVRKDYKKITAHLPLNNAPTLEGVPLLPSLEIVRYDFAEMFYNICKATYPNFDEWIEAKEYNKTKERYKYTEEDLKKAIDMARETLEYDENRGWYNTKSEDKIIKSLQQPKMPVAFECEESVDSDSMYVDYVIYKPKTITNPQGQTVWVGKYIY